MTNPVLRLFDWMWYRTGAASVRRYEKIATTFGIIGVMGILMGQGDLNVFSTIGLLGFGIFALMFVVFLIIPIVLLAIYQLVGCLCRQSRRLSGA